jgi:GNAT superfamily N-acetyltransferase
MTAGDVCIRPMTEADLVQADRVFRLAFGTFMRCDPPESFGGDGDCITTRWRGSPERAFVAVIDQTIIGSVFATNWGSVGFFGPLTVHPDYWDGGVGKRLLEPVMDLFDRWQIRHAGLYTFPGSPKHLGLYQKFGFWPRFLTLTMSKPIIRSEPLPHTSWFTEMLPCSHSERLALCRELTGAVHDGLDLSDEIHSVASQALGETILLWEPGGSRLAALAICHVGPGTEAGSGTCYVKFAAARPGPLAGERFAELLRACGAFGALRGMTSLVGGVSIARVEAYELMLAQDFRAVFSGVTMHRPNEPGTCREGVFLIDDWR